MYLAYCQTNMNLLWQNLKGLEAEIWVQKLQLLEARGREGAFGDFTKVMHLRQI